MAEKYSLEDVKACVQKYKEELADDCAKDGVCEFMFVAPPLPITDAVGSLVNPQAIK